ncbi:MAG: hydroxymethylbilane synthase [Deltaproteobacteria bacterium]|jgi:hydroxymethylbilane synthase|nr:hydroxymethylbilane synthase [Deltaproteobacteria bacterium]
MQKLTIATRGSRLALWQAQWVRERLLAAHPALEAELLILKTRGDIIQDVPLAKIGGKGLFVREIEKALLDGQADLAVHSMKDLPMQLPEGLVLGVITERAATADLLLSERYRSLAELPVGARVGTSSLRRQAQLLALRPDLKILSLRGNVDTRLGKLRDGHFEAIVMAEAGLERLGLGAPCQLRLGPDDFLPAAGQGALGVEFAAANRDLAALLSPLEHAPSRACVTAERSFLAALDGGCQTPIAVLARVMDQAGRELTLEGLVADVRGRRLVRGKLAGSFDNPLELGQRLADQLLRAGAREILEEIYASLAADESADHNRYRPR